MSPRKTMPYYWGYGTQPFFRFGPALYPSKTYTKQAQDLVAISANLTDTQKMIAEYWANGPGTELPPGHGDLFDQFVSVRDHHTVDDDAKMFFAFTAAIHDAGIAVWDAKRDPSVNLGLKTFSLFD